MNRRRAEAGWLDQSGPAKGSDSKQTIVTLVPVDPTLAHVYWDVSPADLKKAGSAQAVLRFYDIKGESFDGTNARGFFDVGIDLKTGSSYASLGETEGSCQVDLGFLREDGRFVTLARSNTVQRPRSAPSTRGEERNMLVTGDYEQVMLLPRGPATASGKPPLEEEARPADHPHDQENDRSRLDQQSIDADERGTQATIRPKDAASQLAEELDLTEWSERSFKSGLSST